MQPNPPALHIHSPQPPAQTPSLFTPSQKNPEIYSNIIHSPIEVTNWVFRRATKLLVEDKRGVFTCRPSGIDVVCMSLIYFRRPRFARYIILILHGGICVNTTTNNCGDVLPLGISFENYAGIRNAISRRGDKSNCALLSKSDIRYM